MAKKISAAEAVRRKAQSQKSNPYKYQQQCLKKGCCANCANNVEAKANTGSGTVFGNYFMNTVPGFQGASRKYRKCESSGEQIVNELNRCKYYKRRTESKTSSEAAAAAIGL